MTYVAPLKEQIENPNVQIRIRKSTVLRLKSKRIPPESYDELLNRIFDEHHNRTKND